MEAIDQQWPLSAHVFMDVSFISARHVMFCPALTAHTPSAGAYVVLIYCV